MFSGPAIGKGAILTLVAIVGKMLRLGLFAKPLTLNNFLKFSFAMNGRGEFSFLIAKEAKEQGILNSSDFSATVWARLYLAYWHHFCFGGQGAEKVFTLLPLQMFRKKYGYKEGSAAAENLGLF